MPNKKTTITTEEWLTEIEKHKIATEPPEGYATTTQIAERLNLPSRHVRGKLYELRFRGMIRSVKIKQPQAKQVHAYNLEDVFNLKVFT